MGIPTVCWHATRFSNNPGAEIVFGARQAFTELARFRDADQKKFYKAAYALTYAKLLSPECLPYLRLLCMARMADDG